MNFINEFFNELLFKDKQVEEFMFDVADGLDDVSEHIVSVKSAMYDKMDFKSIFTLAFKLVLKLLIIVLSVIFTKYMFENCVIVTLLPQYDNLILPNFLEKVLMTFYANPSKIEQMKINALHKDFSWNVANGSLAKYYNLFHLGHL